MNKRAIVYVLGAVLLIGAALMLLPLLVALIYHEVQRLVFPLGDAGGGGARRAGPAAGRRQAGRHVRERRADRGGAQLDRAFARRRAAVHAFGADPVLSRRRVRDDLRLYHHRLEHPARGGGARQVHAVLAQLFALDRRHGHSGVHAGHRPAGRRPGHPPAAGREPRADGRQRWCRGWPIRPRSSTGSILA